MCIRDRDSLPLARYLAELRTVALLPGWGSQALRMHFGEAMEKFAAIEPLADQFIQDQLCLLYTSRCV